jgi:hypothetical protein
VNRRPKGEDTTCTLDTKCNSLCNNLPIYIDLDFVCNNGQFPPPPQYTINKCIDIMNQAINICGNSCGISCESLSTCGHDNSKTIINLLLTYGGIITLKIK